MCMQNYRETKQLYKVKTGLNLKEIFSNSTVCMPFFLIVHKMTEHLMIGAILQLVAS